MIDGATPLDEARRREAEAGSSPGHGPMTDTPPPATEADYGAVEPRLTLDPSNPLPSARAFIDRNYTTGDHRTLVHHTGQFLRPLLNGHAAP